MTRACCSSCQLRFTSATAASLASCPVCGVALESAPSAAATFGYRLHAAGDPPPELPGVIATALAAPAPREAP
jgi:predicted amidophosphoribosyltransferase